MMLWQYRKVKTKKLAAPRKVLIRGLIAMSVNTAPLVNHFYRLNWERLGVARPGSERPRSGDAAFRMDGPWVLGSSCLRNGLHCDWMMFLHNDWAHGRRDSHYRQTAVDSSFGTKIRPTCDPGCNCLPSFLLGCGHDSWCVLQTKTNTRLVGEPGRDWHYSVL